jgi:hypothetical protein
MCFTVALAVQWMKAFTQRSERTTLYSYSVCSVHLLLLSVIRVPDPVSEAQNLIHMNSSTTEIQDIND